MDLRRSTTVLVLGVVGVVLSAVGLVGLGSVVGVEQAGFNGDRVLWVG